MQTGIYEITNTANGKRYIGSASDFDARWRLHRNQLRLGSHHSRFLQRAWNKYGEESFTFRRVLICAPRDLLFYEQRCIDGLLPEYNVCNVAGPMSQLGRIRSDDAKAKMREAWELSGLTAKRIAHIAALAEKKRGQAGPKHSDETRRLLAKINTGKKQSPAVIEKRIAPLRGRTKSAAVRENMSAAKRGKKRSPETIEKMRAANLGKTQSEETREKKSVALKGRAFTAEHRAKIAATKAKNKAAT